MDQPGSGTGLVFILIKIFLLHFPFKMGKIRYTRSVFSWKSLAFFKNPYFL